MADERPDDDEALYRTPRVIAGLLLYVLVAVLELIDALSPVYNVDSIQLALMLGTGGVLLGAPLLARLLR